MHIHHPVFGEIVTSNRLVRGGRWVFRGTIVPLDDVFAELASGMNLHQIWEKHGSLDRRDLEAVALQAFGKHAVALWGPPRDADGDAHEQGSAIHPSRRAAA